MTISKTRVGAAVLLGLAALRVTSGMAKNPELASTWTPAQIQIDGKSGDWKGVEGTTIAEKSSLAIANDQKFLWVLFRTDDARTARLIRMTGLTLYVDGSGGKKKDFYVTYKAGPSREQMRAFRGGQDQREPSEGSPRDRSGRSPMEGPMGDMQRDTTPSLTCFVKGKIVEKAVPPDGSEGPSAAFDTSQGFFTYEFRIPLVPDSVRYYGVGLAPGKPFTLGAVWGDMSKMMEEHGDRKPSFGMGSGEGGMGGEPGGMGRRPGGFGDRGGLGGMRGERPSKQEVWVKTELAKGE